MPEGFVNTASGEERTTTGTATMKQGSPADCFIEISSVERGNENAVGGISRRPAEGC